MGGEQEPPYPTAAITVGSIDSSAMSTAPHLSDAPNSHDTPRIPLVYDDGFRGGISMAVTCAIQAVLTLTIWLQGGPAGTQQLLFFASLCVSLCLFSLIFVVWTHQVFARTDHTLVARIAETQFRRGPSRLSRTLGLGNETTWAVTAAATALIVAIAAMIAGAGTSGPALPFLVLTTAGLSWVTMVYAYALNYFRLNAGGERITFDLDPESEGSPIFMDFVSMSVMVSSVGALSAGTPRTRRSLAAVRTHTCVAFIFNALVVAMTVSLVTTLITAV